MKLRNEPLYTNGVPYDPFPEIQDIEESDGKTTSELSTASSSVNIFSSTEEQGSQFVSTDQK